MKTVPDIYRIVRCPKCGHFDTNAIRSVTEHACSHCGHVVQIFHCPEKLQLVDLGGGVFTTLNLN